MQIGINSYHLALYIISLLKIQAYHHQFLAMMTFYVVMTSMSTCLTDVTFYVNKTVHINMPQPYVNMTDILIDI